MHRFFLDDSIAETMEITGPDAHHIRRVLRMKPGDAITVAGADGQAAVARITGIHPDKIELALEETIRRDSEPPVKVWLAQGMPKGDKLEFVIQKAVELGVAGIIPVQTDNTVVRYDAEKGEVKVDRWRKIAAEAAKQCGRRIIPTVSPIYKLTQVLDRLDKETLAVMPYEAEDKQALGALLPGNTKPVLLIIGPEGGFTPKEVELCRLKGVRTVSLGPRILRTETAALAALAIVMYQCGDLGSN